VGNRLEGTGTSVNPARSPGPAIIVGHKALSQVWLFIVAPLLGGALAALVYRYLVPTEPTAVPTAVAEGDVERTRATP
jgi:aquaporin Z